jgi:DUF4097 and DUF4098 domain-containing protein YvlB
MASPTPVAPPPYYYRRRRSLAGPLVMIVVGVFFLLITSHVLSWAQFGNYFAGYWPVLLILWGAVRLAEYYSDRSQGLPSRGIGAGGVLFLIMLIIFGMSASQANKVNWQGLQGEMDTEDNFFGGMFGQTFTFTSSQERDLPDVKDLNLRVLSDRGDVTISAWDSNKVKVDVNKRVRADDQKQASNWDQQSQPTISVDGNVITVNANTTGSGSRGIRADMEIWVPRKVAADINTRHGDIVLKDRAAYVKASTSHGDISVEDVTGNVALEQRKGDIRVANITGDVAVDGQVNDSSISDIKGAVKLNGDYFGDINLSKIEKGVAFRSSRTDMELARLDGDLNMQSGDLRANKLAGPIKVLTRSKDIHLDELTGDLRLENSNGTVEVHSAKLGTIDIQNRSGDVQVVVPEKAGFQLQVKATNGEINSDFSGLKLTNERDNNSATGTVGNGGPKVQINNEHGNIEIRKAGSVTQEEG